MASYADTSKHCWLPTGASYMYFDKILESIKTIKLRGGIFGNTSLLLIKMIL